MLWSDEVSIDITPKGGWFYTAYLNGEEIFRAWYGESFDEGQVLIKGREFFAIRLRDSLGLYP